MTASEAIKTLLLILKDARLVTDTDENWVLRALDAEEENHT